MQEKNFNSSVVARFNDAGCCFPLKECSGVKHPWLGKTKK